MIQLDIRNRSGTKKTDSDPQRCQEFDSYSPKTSDSATLVDTVGKFKI